MTTGESIQPLSDAEANILERVIKVIRSIDPDKFGGITEDTSVTLDSMGMDSLDKIETAFGVEAEFALEEMIKDEELQNIITLGDIVSIVFIKTS